MTTTVPPVADRTRQRQEAVRQEILAAAAGLAAQRGWDGLSLKELGAAVGMRAPSLYSYFPGKAAILDALFAEGYRQMDAVIDDAIAHVGPAAPHRDRLVHVLSAWLGFCQADPARYRLMMTSAVPNWTPSPEAYAVSLASYQRMAEYLAPIGFTPGPRLDLFTAATAGLVSQQLANDPGGDRWARLLPVLVDMLLDQLPRIPEEVR